MLAYASKDTRRETGVRLVLSRLSQDRASFTGNNSKTDMKVMILTVDARNRRVRRFAARMFAQVWDIPFEAHLYGNQEAGDVIVEE